MKAVKVTYRVQESYVEQNKANINKVMASLRNNPIEGMLYSSYILDDGQTFVHINICRNEETMAKLNDVEEFKTFRIALKDSDPIDPPFSVNMNMVGAGFEV